MITIMAGKLRDAQSHTQKSLRLSKACMKYFQTRIKSYLRTSIKTIIGIFTRHLIIALICSKTNHLISTENKMAKKKTKIRRKAKRRKKLNRSK